VNSLHDPTSRGFASDNYAGVHVEVLDIHSDEGGAPEKVAGLKLFVVDTPDGKLTPELIAQQAWGMDDEHRAQPAVVSITQTTELGTLYTPDEVRAIADYAHGLGLAVHLDGARIWNAAAALGVPFRAFTSDAGVDVVSFGGTKNGLLGAEAIVVLDPTRAAGLIRLRKSFMQLGSKMRFMSAQLLALFDGGLGLASAAHANAMAARLRGALEELALPGLSFSQPTQANAVFAVLPNQAADRIRARYRFYDWDRAAGQVRWMCSFDTTEADIDGFVEAIREELTR